MSDPTRLLSFEEICAADDVKRKDEYVPEWKGSVRFQTMSGEQRDAYVQAVQNRMVGVGKARHLGNSRGLCALLLQVCLVKADGSPLFSAAQIQDLQKKNGDVIMRLAKIAQTMNGLTDDEVEQAAGNSETDRNDESGTCSPQGSAVA